MKYFRGITSGLLTLALALAVAAGAWWLVTHKTAAQTPDKPPSPAGVTKIVKEEDLNTVTLSEEAEGRIGLTVAPVTKKGVRRVRVYGGEVTVPMGRSILVAAPLTGSLKALPSGELKAGQSVKAGRPVFHLIPLLSQDGRATLSASLADAEGQVNNAKTQKDLTEIALDRAKRVLRDGAGSQRQVDEAQAAFNLASRTFDAATARYTILNNVVGDPKSGAGTPIPIDAPTDGLLRTVSAVSGQTVPAGAPLFEVVNLSTVWVRVPLPVTDLDTIDRKEPVRAGKLSSPPGTALATARPVTAPPSANPLSSTVDVYYEMPNADEKLIPGQRLGVTIPLADAKESLTVPWSAVVFDIHGGTWVYEQVGDRRFVRRRVVVDYTSGEDAVLASGPAEGTKVVSAGALQLFGAETGFVK